MVGRKKTSERTALDRPIVRFNNGKMWIDSKEPIWQKTLTDMLEHPNGYQMFAEYFYPDSFTKPFNRSRTEFVQNLSDTDITYFWGMAYRGFGKTTMAWAEVIRRICFRLNSFIVYCCSEKELAERRTESIRHGITGNPLIRHVFGDMKPQWLDSGLKEIFGAKAWKLCDPMTGVPFCMVVPRSDQTTVNGLVEWIDGRQVRPNMLILDDTTDRLRVYDEEYRKKQNDWVFGTLLPCVENEYQPNPETHKWGLSRGEKAPYNVWVLDTRKHSDSLIENCAQTNYFIGARYKYATVVYDEKTGVSTVRSEVENISDAQAQQLFDSYREHGNEDRFYAEFVCEACPTGDAGFPKEFQYYSEKELNLNVRDIDRFIIVDPARTRNPRSCDTAMLAVAVDRVKANVYLRGLVCARLGFEEIGETLMRFSKQYETDIIAVEDTGLGEFIHGPLENWAAKSGRWVDWIWLSSKTAGIRISGEYRTPKECRASSALWLYRPYDSHPKGHVFHETGLRNSALEGQMRSFPESKRWDALDCLGYVDTMLQKLGIMFASQIKKEAAIADDDEYREWTYDDWGRAIERGDWRVV